MANREESRSNGRGTGRRVAFDRYELDLEQGVLLRAGEHVPLRPKAIAALGLLTDRAGELVTRDELRSLLWNDTAVEWDLGLNQIIRELRRTLGDDARAPRFIETMTGRGYRFKASILHTSSGGAAARQPPRGRAWYFAAGAATVMALPLVWLLICSLLVGL